MLVQLLKINKCIVIGVVGNAAKVDLCKSMGCDCVIDKSSQDLWQAAQAFAGAAEDSVTGKSC